MRINFLIRRSICLFAMTFLSLNLWAGRLFQYEDDEGRTVLDDRVPKVFIHKGYKVLNEKGYVVEVIPPAMTEEQKKEFHEKEERQKTLRKLLKTYSGPEDAELARDRQLDMLDSQIGVKKGVIARLLAQKKRETEKAADLERRGRQVHANIVGKVERLDRQIVTAQEEITKRELEKQETRLRFEKDIQKLRALLSKPSKDLEAQQAP